MIDNKEEFPAKEPIFLKRGDGLGWTINFKRPAAFLIFILFLAAVALACMVAGGFIKF